MDGGDFVHVPSSFFDPDGGGGGGGEGGGGGGGGWGGAHLLHHSAQQIDNTPITPSLNRKRAQPDRLVSPAQG